MDLHDELPPAVPAKELLALAEEHHARTARPLGTREVAGHLVGERLSAWGADTVEGDVR
ncbi:hypothetical protein [Streptomyces sp. NPDC058295]|jgi:hypothetical protein|uniref:hypothetical protein n=1 Tax=Streptomyces sp. NPDC058295 TaxID=3346431 RepID=UPI0036E608FA